MTNTRAPRFVALASTAIAVVMCAWLALMHARMVVSPAPQEMREGASVWIERLILEGRNPYALHELPASTDVYGIFYYLVVAPVAALVGNGYAVHRGVSAAAILAACGLLFHLLRRRGADVVLAGTGVMLFYVSSVYFVAPVARPDGLAVLLSLASAALLFTPAPGAARLAGGLLVALLALVTKSYLAYPPFVLAAHMAIFGPRARGVAYGAMSAAAAAALLLVTSRIYPAYISVTLVANGADAAYDFAYMRRQTTDWLVFSLPLLVACAWAGFDEVRRVWGGRTGHAGGSRPDVYAFAALANFAAFAVLLGGHPGAHMTYALQLVTPVALIAVLPRLSVTSWPRAAVAAALPVSLALHASWFPLSFERFDRAERAFAHLSASIAEHREVLGSTEVAGLLALAGRPVVDSGQSEYFWHAASDAPLPGLVPRGVLSARWDAFTRDIADGVASGRFDLVIRSRRSGLLPLELIERHYRRVETVPVDFAWAGQAWPVDLWEPLHRR